MSCALRLFLLFTLTVSMPASVWADTFNRRNLLPGSRASMMGGAYSAIADDASGSWYNPAGIAFTKGNDISMSANAFTKTRRSVAGALGGNDVAEASTSIYPAFAGGTTGIGPLRFGYSYFTSDHDNTDESFRYSVPESGGTAPYIYSRRLLAMGELLHAGASISLPIGSYFSLGVGGFYYRRTRQASLVESSVYATGATFDSNIRQSTLNEGSVTTAGMMLRVPTLSVGLSARIPKRLSDNTVIETSQSAFAGQSEERLESISKPHSFDEVTPPEYTLGLAWQPAPWFVLAADNIFILAETSPHASDGGISTNRTQNWSLGTELSLGRLLVRAGVFTNNSLVSEPTNLESGQPAWINFTGWSSGLGWKGKSLETSAGIIRQVGRGKDQSVNGSSEIYRIEAESTTFLLTSRYAISP